MNNNKKHLCLGRKFLYRLKDKKNGIIASFPGKMEGFHDHCGLLFNQRY